MPRDGKDTGARERKRSRIILVLSRKDGRWTVKNSELMEIKREPDAQDYCKGAEKPGDSTPVQHWEELVPAEFRH